MTKANIKRLAFFKIAIMEKQEEEILKCESCHIENGDKEEHFCPYQNEIYNDSEFSCNCCEKCMSECADSI